MPGQTPSIGNQPTRTQEHGQARASTQKPDLSQRIQHDALLRMQPGELRESLQEEESEELELLEEPVAEEDADMDDLDSDEADPECIEQEQENLDAIDLVLGRERRGEKSADPALDLGEVYALAVRQRGEHWVCSFDPPIWMRNTRPWDNKHAKISPLIALFCGLADWFTREKQPFLQDPCINTLFQGEFIRTGDALHPIVVQKQLLAALNEGGIKVSDQDFSRIKDRIWLVWENGCMPIESLFGRQMHLDWAVAGCLHHVPDKQAWGDFQKVPKSEKNAARAEPLSELRDDPLMLLHILADRANEIAPEKVFSAVRKALGEAGEKL